MPQRCVFDSRELNNPIVELAADFAEKVMLKIDHFPASETSTRAQIVNLERDLDTQIYHIVEPLPSLLNRIFLHNHRPKS